MKELRVGVGVLKKEESESELLFTDSTALLDTRASGRPKIFYGIILYGC
jgi:hypothetical protein